MVFWVFTVFGGFCFGVFPRFFWVFGGIYLGFLNGFTVFWEVFLGFWGVLGDVSGVFFNKKMGYFFRINIFIQKQPSNCSITLRRRV